MDKLISLAAGFGIPTFVLKSVMNSSPQRGGAKLTSALSAIGPTSMESGIATLLLLGLFSQQLASKTVSISLQAIVKMRCQNGVSETEIMEQINSMPISNELKEQLRFYARQTIISMT